MIKRMNLKLLFPILALVLFVFLPKPAMAETSNRYFKISIDFLEKSNNKYHRPTQKFYLDNLEDGSVLIDFSSDEFSDLGVSGKLVYNKSINAIDIINVNNQDSKFSMDLLIDANDLGGAKDLTFNLVGDNRMKGSLQLMAYSNGTNSLTGNGSLNIVGNNNSSCLLIYGDGWKILNANIKLRNTATGLECNGAYGLEIINSTIDIQSLDNQSNDTKLGYAYPIYGIYSSLMEINDSDITMKLRGDLPYGLFSGANVTLNNSKMIIDTEGKDAAFPVYLSTSGGNLVLDVINSEVYLNSHLNKEGLPEGQEILSLGTSLNGPEYSTFLNVSGSIFESQGETAAIYGNVQFKESLNDVYVKKELKDKKVIYPIESSSDKKKLGTFDDKSVPFRFVRIEPHLKTFEIDADSQPIDQKTYEFVRWEVEGFIIDNPTEKKATVKIPVLWNKKASLKAIWKKNDGSIKAVPVATDSTVIYRMPQKIVYKTPLSDMPYLVGYPDMTIQPEGNMTRGEAIATVVRLERIKEKDGKSLKESKKTIYSDVKDGAWYKKYITYAYDHGWLERKPGEAFYPDRPITRGELAQLISHIDRKNAAVAPFADVKGHKYEAAINQAYGNERIKGYGDGTFRPDGQIKRVEVATMLNHLYDRHPDKRFIDQHTNIITPFKDLDRRHWGYYELVEAFEAHEYVRNDKNEEEWIRLIDASVK